MSDMGRQSLGQSLSAFRLRLEPLLTSLASLVCTGDKAASAVKPDSEKSYVEQATDYVKGTLDSVAS